VKKKREKKERERERNVKILEGRNETSHKIKTLIMQTRRRRRRRRSSSSSKMKCGAYKRCCSTFPSLLPPPPPSFGLPLFLSLLLHPLPPKNKRYPSGIRITRKRKERRQKNSMLDMLMSFLY